ncbi:MAG: LysR substrate-binding domain-containing protein [Rudaea sp.]|uniref:LysR family transcriptional regulator n=1 Tax=Rudaea sp. TaxID=2136325 RepID=UPI0039E5C34C
MRLRHIEVFQAILRAGTLTGAARLLNVSQPAASKLLQHAEMQLGFALFTRVGGRLQLTAEGHQLRERVGKISDDLRDLQRLTDGMRQPRHRSLRVVSIPTLASHLLPDAISSLRRSFPDVRIELSTQHSREMIDSILLRESDLGLTLQDIFHPGIEQRPLATGHMVAIAPRGWWPEKNLGKPIPLTALSGAPLIGIAVRDGLGRSLQAYTQYLDPPPDIGIWVQTYQLARSLVANGHGLAMIDPFTACGASDEAVQVRPLEPPLDVNLSLVQRKDGERASPVQKAFIDHLSRAARAILSRLSSR